MLRGRDAEETPRGASVLRQRRSSRVQATPAGCGGSRWVFLNVLSPFKSVCSYIASGTVLTVQREWVSLGLLLR